MKRPFLLIVLTICLLSILINEPNRAMTQSSQGTSIVEIPASDLDETSEILAQDGVITFSEHPLGTSISTQYASQGIIFGGDSPFITTDGSNPTSPVLSGTPKFEGAIEGRFVDPSDGSTPVVVESFKLDAGYFDANGSTRIEWFDPDGNKLGQRTNSRYGIETFEITGGNIARWRVAIIENEPAGYAIDNVSFEPVQASVLFREKSGDGKDGTWGFLGDSIPGFDHTALAVGNLVYESHPGYPAGTYYSEDGQESKVINKVNGIQAEHTKETFKHDAKSPGAVNSPVVKFEEIPIDIELAKSMRNHINSKSGSTFQFISYSSLEAIERTLSPAAQKGGGGTFTCVGVVEWAAERAGHNNGQGFIRNSFESIYVPDFDWGEDVEFREMPLLSPELLNYALKYSLTLKDIKQWYQGIFDPVDFMITDPLGRRLGYTPALGEKNEIPHAFYSKNGKVEQFFIPNPVAGDYKIEFIGLGEQVYGAMSSSLHAEGISKTLAQGQEITESFAVEMKHSAPGDLNRDGCVNQQDRTELLALLNTFTNEPNHPGDIDGNGIINTGDLWLLDELIALDVACAGEGRPVFLPVVLKRYGGAGLASISGTVTDDGRPVYGTELLLRFYNGSAWSTFATTWTDSQGNYRFTNLPTLDPNQYTYVRWFNDSNDSSRLATWACDSIDASTIDDPNLHRCDFDLEDIVLVSPGGGATVSVPRTFYWQKRGINSDDYELNIADLDDFDPYWYLAVGNIGNYTLSSLPADFSPWKEYGWWMWVYGPDGYGVSYYDRNVTFSNSNVLSIEDIPTVTRIPKEVIEEISPPRAK